MKVPLWWCVALQIDIKDMEFPKCISEVIAQHKTEQSPFPPRIGVSLTRQSEYDDLATELKIYLENNTTMTTNCVKLPIDISKLKSKPKPEGTLYTYQSLIIIKFGEVDKVNKFK